MVVPWVEVSMPPLWMVQAFQLVSVLIWSSLVKVGHGTFLMGDLMSIAIWHLFLGRSISTNVSTSGWKWTEFRKRSSIFGCVTWAHIRLCMAHLSFPLFQLFRWVGVGQNVVSVMIIFVLMIFVFALGHINISFFYCGLGPTSTAQISVGPFGYFGPQHPLDFDWSQWVHFQIHLPF